MKWSNARPFNWERYAIVIERFLDYVESGDVKLRYMWLDQMKQNPATLTEHQREYGYYILYYFFAVFCLGLPWHDEDEAVKIELLVDTLPEDPVKRREFREFMLRCHSFRRYQGQAPFRFVEVGEVNSKDHILLQCVDVIIGSAGFRLNKMHLVTQRNGRRAKATKAKEQLYRQITARIGKITMAERGREAYGIGVSTSTGTFENRWRLKFRQWDFRTGFDPSWVRHKEAPGGVSGQSARFLGKGRFLGKAL
jgi:hypothetical protein